MNIENLQEGMVLKSYRHLCQVLGIKSTTGNAKISQMKKLNRNVSYHKEGNKIIIDEIYDEEISIEKELRGKYLTHLKYPLNYMLQQIPEGKSIKFSINELAPIVGLTNDINRNNSFLGKDIIYSNIQQKTNQRTKGYLERTFDYLQNKKIIDLEIEHYAVYYSQKELDKLFDLKGTSEHYSYKKTLQPLYRRLEEWEVNKINEKKKSLVKNYHLDDSGKLSHTFLKTYNKEMFVFYIKDMKILSSFEKYVLSYNEERVDMKDELEKTYSEFLELNKMFHETMTNTFSSYPDYKIKKETYDKNIDKLIKLQDDYTVFDFQKLVNYKINDMLQ